MSELKDPFSIKPIPKEAIAIIPERINQIIENSPSTLCVNIVLKDNDVKKHLICRELIMLAAGVSEEDADWYLLKSSIENEMLKLSTINEIRPENKIT